MHANVYKVYLGKFCSVDISFNKLVKQWIINKLSWESKMEPESGKKQAGAELCQAHHCLS